MSPSSRSAELKQACRRTSLFEQTRLLGLSQTRLRKVGFTTHLT